MSAKGDKSFPVLCEESVPDYEQIALAPIMSDGDILGSVILLSDGGKDKMGEVEKKLAQSAAGFLGRNC